MTNLKSTIKPSMTLKEFITLLWINTKVLVKNSLEFFRVASRYYGTLSFLKEDLSLRLMYLFHNPYSISKRFLQNKGGGDIYAYGETPLTSLEIIAKESEMSAKDVVFELGSGRGRTCFWLHSFIGCKVIGIEYVPEFVERANRIVNRLSISNIEFRLANFLDADFSGATVLYLYGTCLDEVSIKQLIEKFSKLPVGTKIITVSYDLNEYTTRTCFEVLKRFTVPFTWGEGDVFIQVIKKSQ